MFMDKEPQMGGATGKALPPQVGCMEVGVRGSEAMGGGV